jgi:hypothetical protein
LLQPQVTGKAKASSINQQLLEDANAVFINFLKKQQQLCNKNTHM